MYVMNCVTVRHGKVRLVEAVQRAPDDDAALALIKGQIEPELQELLEPAVAEAMSRSVLQHIGQARVKRTGLTKGDIYGAIACFWLVFVSCLPASVPFLIFSHAHFALRVSNALLLVM